MTQSILIIGAGIIGSALAYRLGQSGCSVTLLDPSTDGGTASTVSFGWINASYENPKPYYTLRRYGMEAWTRLLPDLPELPYTQNGTLYADFYGIPLETLFDEHTPWGYPSEWIASDQIASLEPNLEDIPYRALFCEIEAQIIPAAARILRNAALRFTVTAAALVWFVKPPLTHLRSLTLIAFVSAAVQYSLTATGLKGLDASVAALIVQLQKTSA